MFLPWPISEFSLASGREQDAQVRHATRHEPPRSASHAANGQRPAACSVYPGQPTPSERSGASDAIHCCMAANIGPRILGRSLPPPSLFQRRIHSDTLRVQYCLTRSDTLPRASDTPGAALARTARGAPDVGPHTHTHSSPHTGLPRRLTARGPASPRAPPAPRRRANAPRAALMCQYLSLWSKAACIRRAMSIWAAPCAMSEMGVLTKEGEGKRKIRKPPLRLGG